MEQNIEESLKLISEMEGLGFSKIIGTPHTYPGLYENTNKTINDALKNLKEKIPVKLQFPMHPNT